MAAIPLQRDVEYPYSDGRPMAESDVHLREILDLIAALKRRYLDAAEIYVAGNLFLYYRQGDPRAAVAPDVFLVRGVPKSERRVYKLWEEGRAPSLVIEVTSASTRNEDLSRKKACYQALAVEEYFLHDPEGDYLSPLLQGFRLAGGRYQPIVSRPDGSLDSRTTGLTLRVEGKNLRLADAISGERLSWVDELAEENRALKEELARLRSAADPTKR